jgi:hypothetical protein
MKNIVIFSNCAGGVITEMLKKHSLTKDKFNVNHILNYEVLIDTIISDVYMDMLSTCDIFIYQPFNKYYDLSAWNVDNIFFYLKETCLKVKINYYRFKGFYLDCGYQPYIKYDDIYFFNHIPGYGIHKSFENWNGTFGQLKEKIDELKIDENLVNEYFNKSLEELKIIDNNSDVKMYDFFIKNYKNLKLFHDIYHPTNIFFYEIFRQLVKILLDIDLPLNDDIFLEIVSNSDLYGFSLPILPTVKKTLGLNLPEKNPVFWGNKLYLSIYEYYYVRLSKKKIKKLYKNKNEKDYLYNIYLYNIIQIIFFIFAIS